MFAKKVKIFLQKTTIQTRPKCPNFCLVRGNEWTNHLIAFQRLIKFGFNPCNMSWVGIKEYLSFRSLIKHCRFFAIFCFSTGI